MGDKVIECKDCGETFTWSENEQNFYKEKGLSPPKRCPFCRRELRLKRKQLEGSQAREVQHGHQ